jgi:hypothetical protein
MVSGLDLPSAVRRARRPCGGLVVLHTHDDGAVQGGVGLPVSAAVEAVSGRLARRRWMDATPQRRAQAGSDRTRWGLSPATMSISTAVSAPIPNAALSCGAAAVVGSASNFLWAVISSLRCSQRRAMHRSVCVVVASTVVIGPAHSPVQRWISAIFDNGCNCSPSAAGALTRIPFNEIIAGVGALTATSLATLIARIISTTPSADFGDRLGVAGQHRAGGVLGVEEVGLAPQSAVPAIGAHDLDDPDVKPADRGGQSGAVGTGALDREGQQTPVGDGPVDQLALPRRGCGELLGAQNCAEVINGDGDVDVFVGVDTYHDSTPTGCYRHACHCDLSAGCDAGRSGRRDCDGTW